MAVVCVVPLLLLAGCARSTANESSSTTIGVTATGPTTTPAPTTTTSTSTSTTTTTMTTTTTAAPVVRPAVPALGTVTDASLVTADGAQRTYRIYVPSNLPEARVPLLIALHGGTGWGAQFESNSGFDSLAEANGFIVAYPDGSPIGVGDGRVWNGGDCCGAAQDSRDNVDDVAFISALIDTLVAGYPIDATRVYATGHSNGAILSYRLVCELTDKITAAAFQAGTMEIDQCRPSRPISVLEIHGTSDTNIPIDGGVGDGLSKTDFTSPRKTIATIATLDGCGSMTESVDEANSAVTHRVWDQCDDGVVVEMTIVDGASHAWMGHDSTRLQEAIVGIPYPDYDSSLAVWSFLAANG